MECTHTQIMTKNGKIEAVFRLVSDAPHIHTGFRTICNTYTQGQRYMVQAAHKRRFDSGFLQKPCAAFSE